MSLLEPNAEWIEAQIGRVFSRYDRDDVAAAYPVLLMYFARDVGFDAMSEQMKEDLLLAAGVAGIDPGLPDKDRAKRLEDWINGLSVRASIIDDVRQVFAERTRRMGDAAKKAYRRMTERAEPTLPAAQGQARPKGTVTAASFDTRPLRA